MNIVVTGSSKGIGKAIAQKFVTHGANIFLCARNEITLENAVIELSKIKSAGNILYHPVDLSKKNEVFRFAEKVLSSFQKIDILVNNAGTFLPGQIIDEEDGILEHLIETNLYSAYHLTRKLLPAMLEAGTAHIFNISSIAGVQPYANGGAYSISKFALQGFSKNLREELKPLGIKVSTICPGATMSDSWSGSMIDENRIMKASDIADIIWNAYHLSPQTVIEEIVLRPLAGDL